MSSVTVIPSGVQPSGVLQKTIAVGAQSVQITLEPLPNEPVPAWQVTAICGGTKLVHRHTIGATSGQIGSYTAASLQAEIDTLRGSVANQAAAIEAVRQLGAGLT